MLTASFFFFNDTATTEIYTLSLHDALPISHRGQRAAAHRDIPDAVHLQQLLRQYGGGRVVHLAAGERLGGEPEDHDGRVRGVHLVVGGIAREPRRQQRARGVQRRLYVARGTVDVAAEVKLQRDVGRAERARGDRKSTRLHC